MCTYMQEKTHLKLKHAHNTQHTTFPSPLTYNSSPKGADGYL